MMDFGRGHEPKKQPKKPAVIRPYERPGGEDPGGATDICTACSRRRQDDLRGPYCPVCISIDLKVAKCRSCKDYHRRGKTCGCLVPADL